MEIDKVFNGDVDGVADNLFSAVKNSVSEIKAMQQRKAAENVQLVIQALKKIESDLQDKFDGVTTVIEKRVASLKDGRDGVDGRNGRDGKDGRPGRDGADGPRGPAGAPGRDGRDGVDGVSVTDAHIDFDGSLIISLSSGRTINVGEVVAPDLAEKIKVITNGGGTSQSVLDSLASLQSQITALQNLGAVNYVGTWNASTNTPTITGGSGEKGDYYVVSVAGSTSIDGQTLWGVGDWIIFNGTAWQKVDGGSTGDFTNLSVSGAVTLSGGTANGVAYLNGSKALTTGSALWFDGSNLGIGTSSPAYKLDVSGSNPRIRVAPTTGTEFALFQANNTGGNAFIGLENSAGSALSTGAAYSLNLYHGGAYPILFSTSATERMRITSSGDVGIGTTSPTRRVTVGGTANALMDFNATSYRRYSIGSDANGFVLYDDTAGAYRLTVNSSGNMGIGTSSPGHKLEVAGGSYLNGNILTNSGSTFYNATGDLYIRSGTSGALRFGSNGSNDRLILDTSGTLGLAVTPSAWGSEHAAFQLGFSGAIQSYKAGTTAEYLSVISNAYNDNANWRYIRDGAATRYELFEGAHRWFSSASGTAGNAITFTQAMTLDSSGNLQVGTTSAGFGGILTPKVNVDATGGNGIAVKISQNDGPFAVALWNSAASGTRRLVGFYSNSSITGVGSITSDGSSTAYNTSSDYRLKHDIAPMTGALAKVQALKPVTYKWNADGSAGEGFIAHELAEVCPQAVTGSKDAVDEDGNPVYQGIDTSFLVATLTAAIQEQQAMIQQLQADVAALKGA